MSQSTDYTETLKKIKEIEEATSREILEKRKALEEDLRRLEDQSAATVADAKRKGEALIASEVEKARSAAQKDADQLLSESTEGEKRLAAKKLDKTALRKIIDKTILSEFN